MTQQFFRFLITGGIAALVNLASRYALNFITSFEIAVAAAYGIGMITAYVLASLFVFDRSGRSRLSEMKRFAIVNLFSLAIVWTISVGLAEIVFPAIHFTWHAKDVAHVAGVFAPAFASYAGHRSYTFAKTEMNSGA